MMRIAIVLLGFLVLPSSNAAVTITFPAVEVERERLFRIQFDVPSLNLGEPSSKTDFLDEVTNVKMGDWDEMTDLFPDADSHLYRWINYLEINWTGVRSETRISGHLLWGIFPGHHVGMQIWFSERGVRWWEEFPLERDWDYLYGRFDPQYITYRDPSGVISEPWSFALALPVLLLLRGRRPRIRNRIKSA